MIRAEAETRQVPSANSNKQQTLTQPYHQLHHTKRKISITHNRNFNWIGKREGAWREQRATSPDIESVSCTLLQNDDDYSAGSSSTGPELATKCPSNSRLYCEMLSLKQGLSSVEDKIGDTRKELAVGSSDDKQMLKETGAKLASGSGDINNDNEHDDERQVCFCCSDSLLGRRKEFYSKGQGKKKHQTGANGQFHGPNNENKSKFEEEDSRVLHDI